MLLKKCVNVLLLLILFLYLIITISTPELHKDNLSLSTAGNVSHIYGIKGESQMDFLIIEFFKLLFGALSAIEYERLESSIVAMKGIKDKIVVAIVDGVKYLIDGHNRLEICQRQGFVIPHEMITEIPFESLYEAQQYAIELQIGRRNLSAWQKCDVAQSLLPGIEEERKRRKEAGITESVKSVAVVEEAADRVGVSVDTLRKWLRIEKHYPKKLDLVRSGKESINSLFNRLFKEKKPKKKVANCVSKEGPDTETLNESLDGTVSDGGQEGSGNNGAGQDESFEHTRDPQDLLKDVKNILEGLESETDDKGCQWDCPPVTFLENDLELIQYIRAGYPVKRIVPIIPDPESDIVRYLIVCFAEEIEKTFQIVPFGEFDLSKVVKFENAAVTVICADTAAAEITEPETIEADVDPINDETPGNADSLSIDDSEA